MRKLYMSLSTLGRIRQERVAYDAIDHERQKQRVRERYDFMDNSEIRAFKKANPGFDPTKIPGPWWRGEIT